LRKPRVFLSYAPQDREFVRKIAERIKSYGVCVWYDEWEMAMGDSLLDKIERGISSSDYIIVLLSPDSLKSKWIQQELTMAMARELTARDVIIIPVLISDVLESEIPIVLQDIRWLDLRKHTERDIDLLVKQIVHALKIDFSCLDGQAFEKLIGELLEKLGFKNIQHRVRVGSWEADIKAEYQQRDPFGVETSEIWLVETKFYRSEKADLRALYQLTGYLLAVPEMYKGLLVTNSQLTSTARDWSKSTQEKNRIRIRVVEGPELKNLLIRFPDLIKRYFNTPKVGDGR
jgi:hypothetical protein